LKAEATPILEAREVLKRFGALPVLDHVDFTVGADEAVGIVGPNGAGKTTLINVLAGSLRAEGGSVWFRGEDITSASSATRSRLGIGRAHQVPRPFDEMTVFENVFVGASAGGGLRGKQAYARCTDVLDLCGLLSVANRRAGSLGLLHRKRLELARGLATDPVVMLLDESAGGLTDEEATELLCTVREVRAQGIAIVWIEHVVHVLVQVIDRLVCMAAGKIIADGPPSEVMSTKAVVDAYLGSGV